MCSHIFSEYLCIWSEWRLDINVNVFIFIVFNKVIFKKRSCSSLWDVLGFLNHLSTTCVFVFVCLRTGRCEVESEEAGRAADEHSDRFSWTRHAQPFISVYCSVVQTGGLAVIQPHRGPLSWCYQEQRRFAQLSADPPVSVGHIKYRPVSKQVYTVCL